MFFSSFNSWAADFLLTKIIWKKLYKKGRLHSNDQAAEGFMRKLARLTSDFSSAN
jgi:hypothetical protein